MAARQVVRGDCFDLHYRWAEMDKGPRLGLMIPKRLARAASLRNAIRRQGREAFRLIAVEIPRCDLVLRLTRPIKRAGAGDHAQRKVWRTEMEGLLRRLATVSE